MDPSLPASLNGGEKFPKKLFPRKRFVSKLAYPGLGRRSGFFRGQFLDFPEPI